MELFKYLIGFVLITLTVGENCDLLGITLYEDLGCSPTYDESRSCPVKYSCPHDLQLSSDECYLKGKSYGVTQRINPEDTTPSCKKGCTCKRTNTEKATFDCHEIKCHLIHENLRGPDCFRAYSESDCCSLRQKCPPFDGVKKCEVNGTVFREEQRYYPKNTCQQCTCTPNGPKCRRLKCGVQLDSKSSKNLEKGCAPFYSTAVDDAFCCPYAWICPNGSEEVKGEIKKDDKCKFGNRTLNVGQIIEKSNIPISYDEIAPKVRCECVLPPLLSCILE